TFDSNGGTPSIIPSRTVAEGDPIGDLPTVTRSGYNFLGWHDGSSYVTKDTKMGTSDMKLTAKWEYIPGPGPIYKTFTLYFDANGGTCDELSRNLKEGDPYGALPEAQRDDYTFQGWFTSPSEGSKVSPATKMGDADVTVYAQWKFSGEEKEQHEERILPDGSVVEKDTIDRTYLDGRTEHIEETVTAHPDSSEEREYMRIMADAEGKFIVKEEHSVSLDASGNVIRIAYDATDYLDEGTVRTIYDPSGTLDAVIGIGDITEEMMETAIGRINDGESYLSGYGIATEGTVAVSTGSKVTLDSGALAMLDENSYGLYIIADVGSMMLDENVISKAASSGTDVVILIEKGSKDNLTEAQQRVIGDGFAVVVKMYRGSIEVHDIGGTATISLEPGLRENVFVYYIQEDGSHEIVESSYDIKTGEVRFVMDHFSVYLATAEDIDSKDNGFPWWIPLIIAIIVLAMLLAVIYHRRS
ncbi:MAG: hypothetical protein E7Z69_08255, partial [Thermoplasmata archaeon]|nr:hypothetical protein [Thermoplasmata archaeon]